MSRQHETINYGLAEVPELFDTIIIKGTLKSIDDSTNSGTVETEKFGMITCPFFYHCEESVNVENGSFAFTVEDNVYVLIKNYRRKKSLSEKYIFARVDGLEFCAAKCVISGEIVRIESGGPEYGKDIYYGYNDIPYGSGLIKFFLRDARKDIQEIFVRPSDWARWSVGQIVHAINYDNCQCNKFCDLSDATKPQIEMLRMVNSLRISNGVDPLTINRWLNAAARSHAIDMANNCFVGHTGTDGLLYTDRVVNSGYFTKGPTGWVGENCAVGGTSHSVETIFQGWLDSPGHYANLVDPDFKEFGYEIAQSDGCGQVEDNYEGETIDWGGELSIHYCQVFAVKYPTPWVIIPIQEEV